MRYVVPFALVVLTACSQASPSAPALATSSPSGGGIAQAAVAPAAAPVAPAAAPAHPQPAAPPAPFPSPARNFEAARKALLAGYYRDSLTEEDLYRAAVAGMLERADPAMHAWNELLGPSELAELRLDLKAELVGIGVRIELDSATGAIDVKGTLPGSPAERAGVAPPDKIVTVDGKLYKGLTLRDVVADIRGKAGATVTLRILRGAELVDVPVVREKVAYDAVEGLVVAGDVGYVRIPGFNQKTPESLRVALAGLGAKGVRGLVVDVRANPGGSFDDSVEAAGELVPAGARVGSVSKRGEVAPLEAKTTPMLLDLPVAVLIDHDTASSAELLAASLQELRHGTLVGKATRGKWSVQRLEELPNGYAIKFTVGIFMSPSGKSYDGVGIQPDVVVDAPADAVQRALADANPQTRLAGDVQLRTAVAILKARVP
jgi:carboxyl-terminal processing protease